MKLSRDSFLQELLRNLFTKIVDLFSVTFLKRFFITASLSLIFFSPLAGVQFAFANCNAFGIDMAEGSYMDYLYFSDGNSTIYYPDSPSNHLNTTGGPFYCSGGALINWNGIGGNYRQTWNYSYAQPQVTTQFSPSTIMTGDRAYGQAFTMYAETCTGNGPIFYGSLGTSNGTWSSLVDGGVVSTPGSYSQSVSCSNPGGSATAWSTLTVNGHNCVGTPWGTVGHGYSNTAYLSSSPAGACTSQTRTCNDGTMSGAYTAASCSAGCTGTPWGSVSSGYSNTAYAAATADVCSSQTRTCTNGTFSGTYTNTSCTVNSYSITFNSAGGTAVATKTQAYGSAVTAPAAPTRAGYTFAGWSPALAATMPSGGQSLTATWNPVLQSALSLTSVSGTYPTPVSLTTSGGSGTGAVTYVVTAAGTAGCSVTGSTLNYTSAGTCTVRADKAADANYPVAISSSPTTVTINKATQAALTVTNLTGTYPTGFSLSTSGGSGTGAVTYSLVAAGTAGCSVTSGGVVSFTSAGTCTVNATKATDTNYNAVTSANATVTINKATQATLTATSQTVTYPTAFAALSSTGGSGTGAVTFALTSAGTAGCSVVGTVLSYATAGTCTVTATKATDTNYLAASSVAQTYTINKATQAALTVTNLTGTYPTGFSLSTSGGSGTGAVTYSLVAAGTAGCSVTSGGVVSFTSAGTCTVNATKATDTNYNAVTSANATVTITGVPPSVTGPTSNSTGIATSTLGATITSNGGSPLTARGTCYSTTNGNATLALGTCVAEGGTSVSSFTHARTGLTANTTYYFQGYATNAYGTTYSGQSSFTTQSVPVINTPTYASVANVSATLGATLVSTGSTTITARGTCYATTANPVTNCAAQGSVTTGVYTQSRSGLTANTLYYYRGYTTYTDGSGYSSTVYTLDDSFTTPTVPSISTPVSSLTGINGVTLGATITSNGGSPLTARGTCYSTTNGNATLALGTCVAEGGTSVSSFTHARTGLSASTTYYYQGYATNVYGTTYSGQGSFITQTVPTVTSPTSSSVINVSATLGANLTGNGGTTITARGTCYATTPSPVANCVAQGATSTGVYTHSRTSLTPGTLYYYRGYAAYTDGAGITGTSYSIDGTFTTPTVPTVTSPTYASLTDTTVTLGATITTNGGSGITSRGTCWGVSSSPLTNCFPEGATTTTLFTQARTGLPQGTFIYARGYATNVYGTAYSSDTTFTTYAPPTVTSPTVSSVTNVGAVLGATITSDGGSTVLARGTCFGTTSSPATNCIPEGGTAVSSFTQARTGMTPGKLTYYRGYATNAYGISYSVDGSTTTIPNLTDVTVTPGNTQARVNYTTTSALNTFSVVILRSTSPVTDIPVDNTTYSVGNTIGAATVACIDTSIAPSNPDSCTVSGLTNTVPYYFAVFTKETIGGAYSGAITPDGNPSTPDINATLVNLASYRVRNDDGGEATASYNVNENTPVTTDFLLGDKLRARFVLENQKTVLTNKSYQLEYATGSCTTFYQVPRPNNVTSEHWRMEPSPYLADNTVTTHSAGVSIPSGKNFKPGRAQTFNNTTLPIVLKNNEYTEVEYSLRSTGSLSPYIPYCFRLTGTGDSSDFVYSQVLHVLPFSSIYRREAGGGGGGGAAAANTAIEAPTSVATTSTTGGTINSEILPSTTIENVITPSIQQSTTTPTRRRGGGGGVGLLNNQGTLIALTSPTGMVLGDTSLSMCTNMKSRMLYGSTDLTTGGEVSQLQYYLMQKGYLTRTQVTGNYLSATEKAVRAYQKDHHLIVTGIVGKVTREGMREEGCRK